MKKEYQRIKIAAPESFSPAITVGMDRKLPYLVDDGFNGERWITHWREQYGATVIASPPKNAQHPWNRADKRWLSRHRQIVETVFARLCETFRLKRINAHSDWGKTTRLELSWLSTTSVFFSTEGLTDPMGQRL